MFTEPVACARTRIVTAHGDQPSGSLRIRAARMGDRTVVVDAFRTAPFHLGHPSDRAADGSAELIIQGVGPGYLPGDRIAIEIAVESGASLVVRGQGATKLYPSPHGLPASAEVSLTVESRARLVYLPGELIPFRQSVLEQVTRIEVASGGALVLGEIITPGRIAMGERDAYRRLRLDVEARYDGRLCLVERARLDPERRPLGSVARHGVHAIACSLYLIGDHPPLPEPTEIPDTVTWASASGVGYTLVRLLGPTAQAVSAAMQSLIG